MQITFKQAYNPSLFVDNDVWWWHEKPQQLAKGEPTEAFDHPSTEKTDIPANLKCKQGCHLSLNSSPE